MEVGEVVEVVDSQRGWTPAVILRCNADGTYDVSQHLEDSIHMSEVGATLSVICGGSRDSKVSMALPYYSRTRDLTLQALTGYLTSVFKTLYEADPKANAEAAAADKLGLVTAIRAFDENGVPHDATLPFDQFRSWYSEEDQYASFARETFGDITVEAATSALAVAARDGRISRSDFKAALDNNKACDALFDALDADHDGTLDLAEVAAGLSVWCKGSRLGKIRTSFELFDINEDGKIDQSEMARYFTSVFRVALKGRPVAQLRELGAATAGHVFAVADANGDGVLSFEEFAEWYTQHYNDDEVTAALKDRDCRQVYGQLLLRSYKNRLDRRAVCSALGDDFGKVFDIFDAETVDVRDLAASLAVFCDGDKDDKIRFCFDLYDHDRDGLLTRPQLDDCLSAMFKLLEDQPKWPADGPVRVSYDQFRAWLDNDEDDDETVVPPPKYVVSAAAELASARRLLGLSRLSVDDLVDIFAEGAPDGTLSRPAFARLARRCARLSGDVPRNELPITMEVAEAIHDAFEGDDVPLADLVCGLLALAPASPEDRLAAAFALYHDDRRTADAHLERPELENFLLCVFKVLFAVSPAVSDAVQTSPRDLAKATAVTCFAKQAGPEGQQNLDPAALLAYIGAVP